MRRLLILLSVTILGASCTCKPLPCGTACVDEATSLATARWNAEQQWIYQGRCDGPETGKTFGGTWVRAHGIDFCSGVDYFDSRGKLVASRSCCEGECEDYGFVPPMRGEPHDICREVRSNFRDAGIALVRHNRVFDLTVTAEDGGVLQPVSGRMHIEPGHYVAILSSGERIAFSLPPTGFPIKAEEYGTWPSCSDGSCYIGPKDNKYALQFIPELEFIDGGPIDTPSPSPYRKKTVKDLKAY